MTTLTTGDAGQAYTGHRGVQQEEFNKRAERSLNTYTKHRKDACGVGTERDDIELCVRAKNTRRTTGIEETFVSVDFENVLPKTGKTNVESWELNFESF